MSSQSIKAAYYPIRVVSNETGVNAITLRAWERRYGLLTPKRTEKGHRLYTEDDIRLIKQVVTLLNRGIPISQARTMLANQDSDGGSGSLPLRSTAQPSQWQHYREQLNQAILVFDHEGLNATFEEVSQFFPIDITLRFLLFPVRQQLQDNLTQPLGAARLQFYLGFLQSCLAWRLSSQQTPKTIARIAVSSFDVDEHCDLLFIAILLKQLGISPIWLHGNTSSQALIELLRQQSLDGLLLQLPNALSDAHYTHVRSIVVETGTPVFVTGHAHEYESKLRAIGVVPVQEDFQQSALTIRDMLGSVHQS